MTPWLLTPPPRSSNKLSGCRTGVLPNTFLSPGRRGEEERRGERQREGRRRETERREGEESDRETERGGEDRGGGEERRERREEPLVRPHHSPWWRVKPVRELLVP